MRTSSFSQEKIMSSPDHGNYCDFQQISMVLPTFWTLPWYGKLMEFCLKYHGNLFEVSWNFVGSRNDFHDLKTRFFQWFAHPNHNSKHCVTIVLRNHATHSNHFFHTNWDTHNFSHPHLTQVLPYKFPEYSQHFNSCTQIFCWKNAVSRLFENCCAKKVTNTLWTLFIFSYLKSNSENKSLCTVS